MGEGSSPGTAPKEQGMGRASWMAFITEAGILTAALRVRTIPIGKCGLLGPAFSLNDALRF
jgi:hypothetical protein